jgi:hypothetical protein
MIYIVVEFGHVPGECLCHHNCLFGITWHYNGDLLARLGGAATRKEIERLFPA